MLGANGVVAGGIPIAVGAAQGLKMQKSDAIVTCMFGDGAINRGPFLEGLNWAVLFRLPVLFVCEDNGVAAFTRADSVTAGPGVTDRAKALGVAAITIDGNNAMAVDDAASTAVAAVRRGEGPHLLHVRTYRITGHTSTDAAAWRPEEEVAEARSRDPIARLGAVLAERGIPATELGKLFENDLTTLAGQGLTSLTIDSWSSLYGIPIGSVVLPDSIPYVVEIGKGCLTKIRDLFHDKQAIDGLGHKFLSANPVTVPPWKDYIAVNTPGGTPIPAPIFISQGLADTVVDPPVTVDFAKILCGQGAQLSYLQRAGITHTDIAKRTAPQAISWIADRIAGRPAPSNCIK